jgi:hypothetical protein
MGRTHLRSLSVEFPYTLYIDLISEKRILFKGEAYFSMLVTTGMTLQAFLTTNKMAAVKVEPHSPSSFMIMSFIRYPSYLIYFHLDQKHYRAKLLEFPSG